MSRARAALALLPLFLWQVVVSGAATAWMIVRPGTPPESGLIRMRFSDLSPTGAALLASLVTLTPGTTAIDIDLEKRLLLVHLLDLRRREETIEGIHRRFDRHLQVLFPGRTR